MADPVLRVEGVSKSFGPVRAVSSADASFFGGEVHAVLGENGAGKSTLVSAIAGFVLPDSGLVLFQGKRLPLGRPHEIKALGIKMVHQHFMLVPAFSVAENLALGAAESSGVVLESQKIERESKAIADRLGWSLPMQSRTGDLPVGVQQRIEIVRALMGDAQVLILDEPTAVLSPAEVDDLFRVLRQLRDDGKCVVLIAHKLSEVLAIADRVTVLRHGSLVATAERSEVDEDTLASWMVGEMPAPRSPLAASEKEPVAQVRDLWVKGERGEDAVKGVSFDLRPGEVLGIGGVDGNGQNDLAEAVVGLRKPSQGSVQFSDAKCKVGYIPQDRQGDGLALSMSVRDNLLIEGQRRGVLWLGPFLRPSAVADYTKEVVEGYDVKIGDVDDEVGTLSGGNQQKIVVGRVLDGSPSLIVACNPTRGLDFKATAYVQSQILRAAKDGAAVLLFSADLDELAALSTRTLFMSRGALAEGGATALAGGVQ
ncbi:MAG TPA: ABC transporter ATP-binding protein [Fimbriimonadaceae bacterium]|nr:ABC transporter ATP-binding protein [Fimbriimonadaceae bacterium]